LEIQMIERFGIRHWGFALSTVSALAMATTLSAEDAD